MALDIQDIKTAACFRSDYWDKLTPQQKHQAITELTAVSAKELGHDVPEIVFEPMEGYNAGYQINGTIHFNSNLVDDGRFVFYDSNGNAVSPVKVENAGAEVMQTVFHEDTHCHQDAVAKGKVDITEYEAQYVRDMVAGGTQSTYIDPEFDYLLYRIQPQELEAFRRGYSKTEEMLHETEKNLGEDPQLNSFLSSVYGEEEKHLNEAREIYNDPKAEEALGAAIRDRFYGTNDSEQYKSGSTMRSILDLSYQHNLESVQKAQNNSESLQEKAENAYDIVQESSLEANVTDENRQTSLEEFFSSLSEPLKNETIYKKDNSNDYSY